MKNTKYVVKFTHATAKVVNSETVTVKRIPSARKLRKMAAKYCRQRMLSHVEVSILFDYYTKGTK